MQSSYLNEINELLESVKGRSLSVDERKRRAIDLASLLMRGASSSASIQENERLARRFQLMRDPSGKAFAAIVVDQIFRNRNPKIIADRMIYLLDQMNVPESFGWIRRMIAHIFKVFSPQVTQIFVPVAEKIMRKEISHLIMTGDGTFLNQSLKESKTPGILVSLNRLGVKILSETEAKHRLQMYLEDLKSPEIDSISLKISDICHQLSFCDFEGTVTSVAERLKQLYRAAVAVKKICSDGTPHAKGVHLDMEQYGDVFLALEAFKRALEDPEFFDYSAGITLQAYFPNSYVLQQELTAWAMKRMVDGGAPIQLRIVKGAYLTLEQISASLKGWPQAPYFSKVEVDANYKRMMIYGCVKEKARAVRLRIATHNAFDLSFAMLLRCENEVEPYVSFEMLKGMADPMQRMVHHLTGQVLLYCPVAVKPDFSHSVSYLMRCLDESSGADHFVRHLFGLKPGTDVWENQVSLFSQSCDEIESVSLQPRRTQNRLAVQPPIDFDLPFENESDTDFSLVVNRSWAEEICRTWRIRTIGPVPWVVRGIQRFGSIDAADPVRCIEEMKEALLEALQCAKKSEKQWSAETVEHRRKILIRVAQILRVQRGELIGAIMKETRKTFSDADSEVSEAIDFAEYYARQITKIAAMKDVQWKPKGTVLVMAPWNFPCSIAAGGLFASLITGNCVLFRPSSKTVYVGWLLVHALWDAGIPKEVLQFIPCSSEEENGLISDERLNCVMFTGKMEQARSLLHFRPGLDLIAETGGKNAMIITASADRELAIYDLILSAFGYGGQKSSAASLAILTAEVYDDPSFRIALREAALSLKTGSPWELGTDLPPLIDEPDRALKRGLMMLEPGEEWLLQPKQNAEDPCLWSPGIKWNVRPGSFTHQTELFGPVLGVMRAEHLQHAIDLANGVPYGLVSGLHSLDERELALWLEEIEAGNLHINRVITESIVHRQPFGGTKASSFGPGYKTGGPNSLHAFMTASQICLPKEKFPVNEWVNNLTTFLEKLDLSAEQLGLWIGSVANYAYWWKRMLQDRDPEKILGEDHSLRYVPHKEVVLRISPSSNPLDALRSCAAALTCGAGLEISWSHNASKAAALNWLELVPVLRVTEEGDEQFLSRIREGKMRKIRVVEPAPLSLLKAAAESGVCVVDVPVLANGRLELFHFLREVAISVKYHRYGNLGLREGELRKPIL